MNTAMLSVLFAIALKATLVLALAFLATSISGRTQARLRVVIWAAALLGVLLLPGLGLLVPSLSVPIPLWLTPDEVPKSSQQAGNPGGESLASPLPFGTASAGVLNANIGHSTVRPAASTATQWVTWRTWIFAIWLTGAGLLVTRQALGLWRIFRAKQKATPADAEWQPLLERSARLIACHRRVRLLVSNEICTPATAGAIRPFILLPQRSHQWTIGRREVVLQHELVHVSRHDWIVRELARLACAVYWFNPIAWWGLRCLHFEQELACDEAVIASGARPSRYAATLLEIARAALNTNQRSLALEMAHRHRLEGRIMRILNNIDHQRPGRAMLLTAVISFAVLVPTIAALQPENPGPRKASPELEQALQDIRQLEERIEPEIERIQSIEIIALEEEIDAALEASGIHDIELELEPLIAEIEAIHIDIEPFLEQFEALGSTMGEIDLENVTLSELSNELNAQLRPQLEKLRDLEIELEPFHEHMREIELHMGPLEGRLEALQENLEPHLEQLQEKMKTFEREFEPIGQELKAAAGRVESAVAGQIESVIRDHMGSVTGTNAPMDEAASKIIAEGNLHINDNLIKLRLAKSEVRQILADLLEPFRIGTDSGFNDAIESAARELSRLEIETTFEEEE